MFKDIQTWDQKKLKNTHFWFTIAYFGLTYVCPVLVVLLRYYTHPSNGGFNITFTAVVILAVIAMISTRLLSKHIDKIQILNLDGTYAKGAQLYKHLLSLLCSGIFPIAIFIGSAVASTILKEKIDFFVGMVMIILAFYIAGLVLDKLFISCLEEEIEIRQQVAKDAAVDLRKNNLNS